MEREIERKLNPLSDYYARYLLGSEENIDLLKDFINAVLEEKGYPLVVELEIKNPFNLKEFPDMKESILDVKARDSRGRTINIEVQIRDTRNFAKRSLYYWAKLYQSQLKTGDIYTKLKPVISINLLDFMLFPDLKDFHSCFQITEKNQPEYILSEHLQIHFVELPKLELNNPEDLTDRMKKWCYYFKEEGLLEEDMPVLLKDDPIFEKAHRVYHEFTTDDHLMEAAEARRKWRMDQDSMLYNSREEGREEGIEETARRMLAKGFLVEDVSEITTLSAEVVEQIRKEE